MKIKALLTAGLLTVVTAFPLASQAQYAGPSETSLTTVQAVLDNAKDDTYVTLRGKITRQVGEEKYIFADETGEIRVEIEKEVFKTTVDDKSTVEIRGEVEKDFMESPEIDVDSIVAVTE